MSHSALLGVAEAAGWIDRLKVYARGGGDPASVGTIAVYPLKADKLRGMPACAGSARLDRGEEDVPIEKEPPPLWQPPR